MRNSRVVAAFAAFMALGSAALGQPNAASEIAALPAANDETGGAVEPAHHHLAIEAERAANGSRGTSTAVISWAVRWGLRFSVRS